MVNTSISSYSFEDSDKIFGYNHRINITMSSGKVYNIAAEEDSGKFFLPKCIRKIFWAKVYLSDSDGNSKVILINKNSLAKRTGTSDSLTKFALKTQKKDQNFDAAMRILHKADKIAETMEKDYWFRSRQLKKAGEIVKIIEKNKVDYSAKAAETGDFVERKKGHTFVVRIDPKDPSKTNFYIKQAKLLGKGGFKTVYPLMDYETQESKYAISIQKGEPKRPSRMDHPRQGYDITTQLHDAKNIMQSEVLYEEGVTRDVDGKAVKVDKNAVSYLVTKLYQGTFSGIAKSNKISLKYKLMFFTQILQGVSDMHAKGIVHCDLKNDNVLYKFKDNKFKIKIIDFDLSSTFEKRIANRGSPGTPNYLAPESLSRSPIAHPDKLDSWSLGIMLYELCEGKPEFFHKQKMASREDWADIIIEGTQNLPFKNLVDENDALRLTIKGLLNEDSGMRLSVNDALGSVTAYIRTLA